MRSNLLSLQNISGQVSSTQNKLATGNKVNSAIDNPSSYYTALSLNNRADDLNALLDSMGQAVSTIKAATTALESATEFLEQASAVATQALETAKVPSKSFFEEKVGENGAVVTTAQELRDAITAGKETICVYGAIDLGDISTENNIVLKENQKLVGVGYFGNYDTDTDKFSSVSAHANTSKNMITLNGNNTTISDLSVNYDNNVASGGTSAIYVTGQSGKQYQSSLHNLDVNANFSNDNAQEKSAISIYYYSEATITGKINVQAQGRQTYGIFFSGQGVGDILSATKLNIQVKGQMTYGIYNLYSTLNVHSNTNLDITQDGTGRGISNVSNAITNVSKNANIRIKSQNFCLFAENGSTLNVEGNIYVETPSTAIQNNNWGVGSVINIGSSAQIYIIGTILNGRDDGNGANILDIAAGAKLAFEKDGKTDWYEVKENWQDENTSTTTSNTITADNVKDKLNLESTSAWELPEKIEIDLEDGNSNGETAKQDLADAGKNYQEIINQYDSLIKDAGYKGINLLQNDKLTVKFNETNTADLSVQGQDMSSQALGFKTFDWQTQADIADSLAEIANALQSIRNYSSELGNNYSIITTRQDFTESLVNVLTEGADKLTLADMNEESANMLALQTRQQLAINSLSLASQASQSILKLF